MNVDLKIFNPEYYHRDYKNDFPSTLNPSNLLRLTKASLPFLSLHKTYGQPLSLAIGLTCRTFSAMTQISEAINNQDESAINSALFQTILSISTVAAVIFSQRIGMLMMTCQDLHASISELSISLAENDTKKSLEISFKLFNNLLYLALFFANSPEILIASTAIQILQGLYESLDEFKNGNYLEGSSLLLMAAIRGKQLYGEMDALKTKKDSKVGEKELEIEVKERVEASASEKIEPLSNSENKTIENELKTAIHKPEILKKLIDEGVDINMKLEGQKTALHYAAESDETKESLSIILNHGAHVNAQDIDKRTALHFAVNSPQNTKLLLEKGADFHIYDAKGMKPLYLAYKKGNIDVLKALLEKGASLREFTPDGGNALHHAAELKTKDQTSKLKLLKFLIEDQKMDVNEYSCWPDHKYIGRVREAETCGSGSYTAIGFALRAQKVLKDDFKVLQYLIDQGAYTNIMFSKLLDRPMRLHPIHTILSYGEKVLKLPEFTLNWLQDASNKNNLKQLPLPAK